MAIAHITAVGSLVGLQPDTLIGVTDISVHLDAGQASLYVTTRGGGYVTGFDLGDGSGVAVAAENWWMPASLTQTESTDILVRSGASGPEVLLAGLANPALLGVQLDPGGGLGASVSQTAGGFDMSGISTLHDLPGQDAALAALADGGLVLVRFSDAGGATVSSVGAGAGLGGAVANAVFAFSAGGGDFALVSYGAENTLSLYRVTPNGLSHLSDIRAGAEGFWVNYPSDMIVLEAGGRSYVVVAATGTQSLTVLALDTATGAMTPVDHVMDNLNTRFDDTSHLAGFTFEGRSYLLAAGSDQGLTLMVLLPGGRLDHVDTFEGSAAMPLRGITALDVLVTDTGVRIWVATESAPYLSELSVTIGATGDTLIAAAAGGVVTGGGANDILTGQGGDDTLSGGGGADLLQDGAGSDRLTGGAGADRFVLSADARTDTITDFQLGLDQIDLSAWFGGQNLSATTFFSRSWGAEVLVGEERLLIYSANGSSLTWAQMSTGSFVGLDRVPMVVPDISSVGPDPDPDPTPEPEPDSNPLTLHVPPVAPLAPLPPAIALPTGAPTNLGSAGGDRLLTNGSNEYIVSGAGNDTVDAGGGNDTVQGDGGADRLIGGDGNDLIWGNVGFDTLIGGNGRDTLLGGDHADLLEGGSGNDLLSGGAGFDVLHGQDGSDTLWGGASPDRLYGGAGNDVLSAGTNFGFTVDGLFGEAGNDTLFGDAGFDMLDGGDGDDVLDGGHQADNLFGRAGNDTMFGGLGFDRLFGGPGDDQGIGGAGTDGLFGDFGNDTLWGGADNDRIFGGTGNDVLYGDADQDTLWGGAGFDTLVGGAGNDLLEGNFNADTFVFADGHGNDTITDFAADNRFENIDLRGVGAITALADLNLSSATQGAATQVGGNVLIDTGPGSSILLQGVILADLDATDFIF